MAKTNSFKTVLSMSPPRTRLKRTYSVTDVSDGTASDCETRKELKHYMSLPSKV